jgi:predicted RNA-binding protein with PIN domain
MTVRELIVDGYNIVHAWPELAPLIRSGRGEEARRRLIATLADYSAATGERVTVVFDAHGRARDHGEGELIDGVRVVFGSSAQTADHVIERRVAIASAQGDAPTVTVATGDRLQRDLVMAMGAAVIGAEALRQVVLGAQAEMERLTVSRRREAGFANRLEDRIDPLVRGQLDRLRRPAPAPVDDDTEAGAETSTES